MTMTQVWFGGTSVGQVNVIVLVDWLICGGAISGTPCTLMSAALIVAGKLVSDWNCRVIVPRSFIRVPDSEVLKLI